MKLIKLSKPGWIRSNLAESQVKELLYTYICAECREGSGDFGEPAQPVGPDADLGQMLATACGCEFMIEEDDEERSSESNN